MTLITVQSGTIDGDYQGSETSLIMRIYNAHNFTNSADVRIAEGRLGSRNFYAEVNCSVAAGVITYDEFTLDSTTDALENQRNTFYVFGLYTENGSLRGIPYRRIRVPHTDLTTDMTTLALASQGPNNNPSLYYTKEEILDLFADMLNFATGIISNTEFNALNGITANIQAQINAIVASGIPDGDKGDITVTGGGSTFTINNGLDPQKLADGSVNAAEFQRLNGVTSPIQTQLDSKADAAAVATAIGNEATARANADTALSGLISDEAAARIAADLLKANQTDLEALEDIVDDLEAAQDGFHSAQDFQIVTPSIADLAVDTGITELGKLFTMVKVTTSHACRIRLYQTASARGDDAARLFSDRDLFLEGEQHGIILDLRLVSDLSWTLSPSAVGSNGDDPRVDDIYYSIQNLSGGATAITVDIEAVVVED